MPNSILGKLARMRILGKSPVNAYLRVNEWIWNHTPPSLLTLRPLTSYGRLLHAIVRLQADRRQYFGTLFLRNRPQLELIQRIANQRAKESSLSIAVLGCSNGAEAYSILWTIRSARPDLTVATHAMDISRDVLTLAQNGVYSIRTPELVEHPIFERMTEREIQDIFEWEGEHVSIRTWLKEGIIWHHRDAGDPEIVDSLGRQDIVIANNFLCHMDPPNAERCLRNISTLVKQDGYLFVSGIDLAVRTKVARDLGWKPVPELIEEIHNGDHILRVDWPFKWWGLEPFNQRRHDWQMRYASVFMLDGQN